MSLRRGSAEKPARTCVQCGVIAEKGRLLRIAGRPGSAWVPDPAGKLPGRGIYLCREGDCIERFALRIRTRKGGARWRMGDFGSELAERLTAIRDKDEAAASAGGVDGQGSNSRSGERFRHGDEQGDYRLP